MSDPRLSNAITMIRYLRRQCARAMEHAEARAKDDLRHALNVSCGYATEEEQVGWPMGEGDE